LRTCFSDLWRKTTFKIGKGSPKDQTLKVYGDLANVGDRAHSYPIFRGGATEKNKTEK